MSQSFDEKLRALHEQYVSMDMEQRRELLEKIKHKNILKYRKLERIKHDLLRMETRRAQLSLDEEDSKELSDLECRILEKKAAFLKLMHQQVK